MPCNTIQLNKVDLAKTSRIDLLNKALDEVFRGRLVMHLQDGTWVRYRDGRLVGTASAETLADYRNRVARAYSAAVVKEVAAKRGWQLKPQGNNQFVAVKGGF
jgi:hypothetical protein